MGNAVQFMKIKIPPSNATNVQPKQRNPHSILYDFAVNEFAHLNIVAPPSLTKPLRDAIASFVGVNTLNAASETWVLSHDYGWSPLSITAWSGLLPTLETEKSHLQFEMQCQINTVEQWVNSGGWAIDGEIKGLRIYFFFLFMEFEREHRDAALAQVDRVRDLVNENFLKEVATTLDWNEHQLLECHQLLGLPIIQ